MQNLDNVIRDHEIKKKFNELAMLLFDEDEANKNFKYGKEFESSWRIFMPDRHQNDLELKSSVYQIWRMKFRV